MYIDDMKYEWNPEKNEFKGLQEKKAVLDNNERERLAAGAVLSVEGVRRRPEPGLHGDYRQAFAVDADRILHSLSYSRYIDKTQVFSMVDNDHITHRILHVQLVSKIARTAGRFLRLNEDLLEAIALGHDIGHPPFAHTGERHLSELCADAGIGTFHHNVQSVFFQDRIERKGKGVNLCLQTLDGILCHDGELHTDRLKPAPNPSFDNLDAKIRRKMHCDNVHLIPGTTEGCIVRMADTIGYIGRDIEDAIRLGLIERDDIPVDCSDVLGDTNGKIVYALVTDMIENSSPRYASFSPEISSALKRLKSFNYERIYRNPAVQSRHERLGLKEKFQMLFKRFLKDIALSRKDSPIYRDFLEGMAREYMDAHKDAEIVRDFIAGMTDGYFLKMSDDMG